MLLSFDVAPEAVMEHDDWHTHEHMPERVSIAGFLRGTRWVAHRGEPRYFVMYEVAELATLTSAAYLERLNNPTPWTSKMMVHYRGMNRGFCSVRSSLGFGMGHVALLIRFKPQTQRATSMRSWLLEQALPELPRKPGIASVHAFESALTPPMTNEQRIRGADAGFEWAILVTGYREDALSMGTLELEEHGATGLLDSSYGLQYSLSHHELQAGLI